jgi:hypothetical protein
MLGSLTVLLCLLAAATPSAAATVKYQMDCNLGKGTIQAQKTQAYSVVLTPLRGSCHVEIRDAHQKTVFDYDGRGIQVFVGSGVTADTSPNAIVQSDGPPDRLFIVSLGDHARLLRTIENKYGFWLQNDRGGKVRIWTADGAFQDDPDLRDVYHNDLFMPEVVFEMRGDKLVDATPECREYFDREINSARSHLPERAFENFRANRIADNFRKEQVKGYILKIVFCYLYTGREQQAKEFIDRVWPSNDSARLWKSITGLRSEGVLRNISEDR